MRKSRRVFSAIAIDRSHEQNNISVKGDGGAVGLTENPATLHRWMVFGPELTNLNFLFKSDRVQIFVIMNRSNICR